MKIILFFQSLCGMCVFFGMAFLLGQRKQQIDWKKIGKLFFWQNALLLIGLKIQWIERLLGFLGKGILILQSAVGQGTRFVFGYVGGGEIPFVLNPQRTLAPIFMFEILPMVVVMGALAMMFFYWGILPKFIQFLSNQSKKYYSIGGSLAGAMVAKIFWGQSETPLFVKPYLDSFSDNELISLMAAGMITASSTLFGLYSQFLGGFLTFESAFHHIFCATLINIPAALLMAELLAPQGEKPVTQGDSYRPFVFHSTLDAMARGALDGWDMITKIGALMICVIALLTLVDKMFSYGFALMGWGLHFEDLLGYVFSPLVWLMGVPAGQSYHGGMILGKKILFNEVVALDWLAKSLANGCDGKFQILTSRSVKILIYALCNFGHISSISLQMGTFLNLMSRHRERLGHLIFKGFLAAILGSGLSAAMVSWWV